MTRRPMPRPGECQRDSVCVPPLVTDGVLLPGGSFVSLPGYDETLERLLTETFRRLVLHALYKEERISETFLETLATWRHGGGFSAYARHLILNEEPARLAHMTRYLVRPPVATDRIHATTEGRVLIETPTDPRTGATTLLLDPVEWVRRMTNQIPDARMHLVRYYAAYANRSRKRYRSGHGEVEVEASRAEGALGRASRASWARLLKRVFGVDLVCPPCRADYS